MARVLITGPVLTDGLSPLAGHDLDYWDREAPLKEVARDADAMLCLLTDRVDEDVLAVAERMRVVANVAVGYDNIDVEAARTRQVIVTNTPGLLDDTTADTAFVLILAACRQTTAAETSLRTGGWRGFALDGYLGVDVHGAVLGLVGYGRIAQAVARRASGFDMVVRHHARRPTGADGYVASLDELLREADIVSVHVPLTDDTRRLVDERRIGLMKPTAVLVNTSRGPVVDELALAQALGDGRLFGAGLDVYDGEPDVRPELLAAPRLTLLPHIGSATRATRTAMVRLAAENIAAVLDGRPPLTPV